MVKPKTEEEIELLLENGTIVSKALAVVGKAVAPGVTTMQLNRLAETFIRDNGAIPSFLGFDGFPAALCMSVNDTVVHGFPSNYVLQEGDIVSVDCGTLYKGYNGDSAYTFPVGEIDAQTAKLLETTKQSLFKGIAQAVDGNRVGDIGHAVQTYCEAAGFSVVRELEGHGIGKGMHENPGVPNFGKQGRGPRLYSGMTICIEPMINAGGKGVYLARNGWEVRTADHMKSAHYELTVVVRKDTPQLLSTFDYIEGKVEF